ncbi:MAG: transcriptional repressor LexA [Nitrospinota bacterium]|nr:transcriptional repressor LexA [Nitrospinota bacterium]
MYLTPRQQEIYTYTRDHICSKGYAPSIMEIARRFKLTSPATVHKHLTHLETKRLIRRQRHQNRGIELVAEAGNALAYVLLGRIAAGKPIEALEHRETISIMPEARGKDVFVLQVKGNSMIDDHIQDGDYVIAEKRDHAENGETVVALLDGENATLKRFYQEKNHIRLQPANPKMEPIIVKKGKVEIQGVVIGVMRKFK